MRDCIFRRFSLALFFLLAAKLPAQQPPVQLLLPSRTLEPKSTFELRFASEMVSPGQIGRPAAVSPLVFQPPIAGQFVWLSTQSGTFAPDDILPLATRFQITLRPGLKDAAGKEVPAKLRETAETPPFRVKGSHSLDSFSSDDASVRGRHLVLFNANVDAAAAAKFCSFIDAGGNRVPAHVEQADDPTKRDRTFRPWQSDDKTLTIWGEDPPAPTESDEEDEVESGEAAPKPIPKRGNLLFVAPVKPLPPGKDWRLVLEAGLPSTQWKAALPSRQEIRIGAVKPFVVASVAAEANRTEGRRLVVELSKPLAEEVTAENIGRWMKVEPAPEKLRAQVEGSFVTWRGEFALGQQYLLTVAAGLPAREPVATDKPFTKEVAFQKIAPRLYFQDFAVHQYARGSRELRLLSLNIPRVRVVAKLFTGAAIPAALKAYDKYMEQGEEQMEVDEMFARVDPAALPGDEIWTKELAVGGEVDSQQMLSFSWDEIVGQNRTGVVMLTAESIDPVLANGKRVGTQTIIQLTDIGAIWKRDREGVLLHVFSLATGKKLPAAQLRLLDREAGHVGEAVTDEQGNARMKLPDEARWVSIKTGDDTHVISVYDSENSLPLYRLGVTEESSDNDDAFARSIFLFTERGVYKPGDKVHLKGYARDPRDNQPQTPAGKRSRSRWRTRRNARSRRARSRYRITDRSTRRSRFPMAR